MHLGPSFFYCNSPESKRPLGLGAVGPRLISRRRPVGPNPLNAGAVGCCGRSGRPRSTGCERR